MARVWAKMMFCHLGSSLIFVLAFLLLTVAMLVLWRVKIWKRIEVVEAVLHNVYSSS